MPTLEWIGKDKVVNHHLEVPYRVLEERYTYNAEKSENMIIRGDNLEALKALLPRYEGQVKCIYIDPPYNTGNEGWVYNDNVNDPRIKKWLGEVVGQEGMDLTRHDKWLCMMYPHLKLLHKLMSNDGTIFISLDDSELYNAKMICDEIFGSNCFVANIIWGNFYGRSNAGGVSPAHNYTLVYSKAGENWKNIRHLLPRSNDSEKNTKIQTMTLEVHGEQALFLQVVKDMRDSCIPLRRRQVKRFPHQEGAIGKCWNQTFGEWLKKVELFLVQQGMVLLPQNYF